MTPTQHLALTIAAHNHVAIEDSEQDSLALFHRLKALSTDNANMQVISLGDEAIASEYDYLTVLELVELIEHETHQLLEFGQRMLDAAHQGLMAAVEEPGFEMDASRWDFKAFADNHLREAMLADATGPNAPARPRWLVLLIPNFGRDNFLRNTNDTGGWPGEWAHQPST